VIDCITIYTISYLQHTLTGQPVQHINTCKVLTILLAFYKMNSSNAVLTSAHTRGRKSRGCCVTHTHDKPTHKEQCSPGVFKRSWAPYKICSRTRKHCLYELSAGMFVWFRSATQMFCVVSFVRESLCGCFLCVFCVCVCVCGTVCECVCV
jgi:hypothetical protein